MLSQFIQSRRDLGMSNLADVIEETAENYFDILEESGQEYAKRFLQSSGLSNETCELIKSSRLH